MCSRENVLQGSFHCQPYAWSHKLCTSGAQSTEMQSGWVERTDVSVSASSYIPGSTHTVTAGKPPARLALATRCACSGVASGVAMVHPVFPSLALLPRETNTSPPGHASAGAGGDVDMAVPAVANTKKSATFARVPIIALFQSNLRFLKQALSRAGVCGQLSQLCCSAARREHVKAERGSEATTQAETGGARGRAAQWQSDSTRHALDWLTKYATCCGLACGQAQRGRAGSPPCTRCARQRVGM